MSPDRSFMTDAEREAVDGTVLVRERLEEQYRDLSQQHQAATLGMWAFLATEIMFFGVLFLAVAIYHHLYPQAFEAGSSRLNWVIGGVNTLVLLVSSFTIVMAVHYAEHGRPKHTAICLALTALLGVAFLGFKGVEYYIDYEENLIPGWKFVDSEWTEEGGLGEDQVPQVKLFLFLYWVMTSLHAVHVTVGIGVVLVIMVLAWQGRFTGGYFSPVDCTALYWHFVDIVWIFLLPTLYLLGGHHL